MLAPSLALFAVFVAAPMFLAIVIAFKRVDIAAGISHSPWVGFQNFHELFSNELISVRVMRAFRNTLLFSALFVPLNLIMALVVATLIHSVKGRWQAFYRAAFYLPTVTSAVVFAMIWKYLYNPQNGLLNLVLGWLHLPSINWTGDPSWALWAVIIAALGAGPGGNVLIYLAALSSVPEDTLEAARVDGANVFQRWWNVTVPALRPVTLYLIVLNTIGSFQVFELVFVLTSGGPAGSSTVLVYEIYTLAFTQGRYGIAGALALILLLIVVAFTAAQFFLFGGDRESGGTPRRIDRIMDAISEKIGDTIGAAFDLIASTWPFSRNAKPRGGAGLVTHAELKRLKALGNHAILLPFAMLFLFPMLWMFIAAVTPRVFLQANPPQISPAHMSFENYERLIDSTPKIQLPYGFQLPLIERWFWNSFYIALLSGAAQVLLSCLAGYVFARLRFPGRGAIFALMISSIVLPGQALIIPLFIVISSGIRNWLHLDLMNTHWAILLPGLCSPIGIFLMKQYIESLPKELEEAARIDGCGEFGIWWRVIVPLCRPVLGAWGILTFTGAWKSFFWPFVVLGSEKLFTLEVGVQTLQQQNTADYGLIMAGATISAVPMIVIFFIFQKQIVSGLTFGAVKG